MINKALEKEDEEVVADLDRENFRRHLAKERTVRRHPPKRASGKRGRDGDDEEWDDGGGDAQPIDLGNIRSMRV